MTWLARLSLRNRALVGLVTVLLVAFGVLSTTSLRQELFPSLDSPVATVVTPYPGASPDVVEQQVTTPVEQAVGSLAGVTGTSSTSTTGSSVVTLQLEYGTDLDALTAQVQRAVQGVSLPADVTPQVVTGGIDSIPVVQLAVSSNLGADRIAEILRSDVQPLLQGLDGVSSATLSGLADEQIVIDVDPAAAAARGVSVASISSVLQANGVRVPAGQLTPDTNPLTVEVGTPITSVEQVADLYVGGSAAAPTGAGAAGAAGGAPVAAPTVPTAPTAPVRLGDIATVTSQPAPATGYTRSNGEPSIGIGVVKTLDANTVAVSGEVRDTLAQIADALGGSAQNAQVTVVFDQAPFIEQSVHDLTVEGLLGLAFAVIVILLFLLSVRATLVTAVSIPLSVLIAMIVLDLGGYTLNILTLGALTVAVGRVVDDSIVVIENITRHVGTGRPTPGVVVGAVREVAGAITASTITTVAVFAPIGLVGGQVGQLFRPFAVTVTAALLASLLVSLTVVPVLASVVLRGSRRPEKESTALQRAYVPVVRGAVRRPVVSLLVAVLILAGTLALVPRLTTNFLGDAGGDTVSVSQEMPPGTALPQADAAARTVEDVVRSTPGVQSYQVTVGGSGGGFGPVRSTATRFSITLADGSDATAVQEDLRNRFTGLTGVGELTVGAGQGGLGSNDLQVAVRAQDPQVLAAAAAQVEQAVAGIDGVSDVRNDLAAAQPIVDVQVDREAAARAGLTEAQVGQTVAAALRGTTIGRLTIDGVEQTVVVRTGEAPADVPALRALPVGRGVLADVATVTETTTAPTVSHTDGARSATITARPESDDVGAATASLRTTLDGLALPAGATAEIGGVSTQQDDAFAQLGLALLAAIAVVYLVMVVTFRSLVQPLILLVSVPFAATGAIGLLLLTGTPLGVPALIGMLMLVGIVVTNAIVLIDLVNQHRRAGRPLIDAVLEGAAHRVRPIIMTAVATIMALLPMSLGLTGGGVFISQPLAVVVIGGLISSTLLTLVLVPVLYVLVERLRARLTRHPRESDALPRESAVPGPRVVHDERPSPAREAVADSPPEPSDPLPEPPPEVAPGPGVHGVVRGDGAPVGGASVVVFDASGTQLGGTRTDGQGRYAVALPAPGEYLVVVHGPGREPVAAWAAGGETSTRHDAEVTAAAPV
ncbi:efflux RND transporter permease subunit [Pseudonocardia oroxyli]|uniref:Hydrophobic/amphiphilic exporter-1, HAE1 family n=1 Tax=Pseudonocardia oroxyli TaxID=366584 RepID=A0A1G7ZZY7_PSEOR|nr:efflux RND transporter permease subunit [Pseudonocardia oroxyli]SDH14232.1 hydrophobic/amphiphilic exporter-1, HAE1 family [Pseudonocardia oroxyli]